MNSLKNIWSQFKKFIRFDQSTFIQISSDRYESGNALIVVLLSLLSIYIPLVINASVINIADIIFYGVVDGIFAWLLVFTGYSHGLVGFIGIVVLINSFINIPALFLQVTTLSIFVWMYFVLSKSLRAAFLFEDRVASITTVTFLVVLTLFSDPIRIFV